MHISAITPQQHSKDRVSLYADDQFVLGLHLDVVADFGLRAGTELSEQLLDDLKTADAFRMAYDKALGYLAVRPRAEKEMKQYLREKLIYRHPEYAKLTTDERELFTDRQQRSIELIMAKLRQQGYLSDAVFAKWWIDNRRQFRPRGKRLLLLELQAKGVSTQDIEAALTTPDEEGHFQSEARKREEGGEVEAAYGLAQKYARKYSGLEAGPFKQKIGRYLASKGYDWDVIEAVIKRMQSG